MSRTRNRDQQIFSIISHHLVVNLVLPDDKLFEVKNCFIHFSILPTGITWCQAGHTVDSQ